MIGMVLENIKKTYTLDEVRRFAGSNTIYRTKAGYVYTIKNGKKEYVRIPVGQKQVKRKGN